MTETDILDYYNERAAIAEYCGELDRDKANLQAYFELRKIYKGPMPESIKADFRKAKRL